MIEVTVKDEDAGLQGFVFDTNRFEIADGCLVLLDYDDSAMVAFSPGAWHTAMIVQPGADT